LKLTKIITGSKRNGPFLSILQHPDKYRTLGGLCQQLVVRLTWKCTDGGAIDLASDVTLAEPGPASGVRKEVATFGLVGAVVAVLVAVANVVELDAQAIVATPLVLVRQWTQWA